VSLRYFSVQMKYLQGEHNAKTNCYWKAIIYKVLVSAVGSFLMLIFLFYSLSD